MPVVSSILLVAALVLAAILGPQTRPWTWGPSLVFLGLASLAAIPGWWKKQKAFADWKPVTFAILTIAWFAWKTWTSPVHELGLADLSLLTAATGSFVVARKISNSCPARDTLAWGIALLLLANLSVIIMQLRTPGFSPVFGTQEAQKQVTGFFGHYNPGANFLIATSVFVGSLALFGSYRWWFRLAWSFLALAGLAAVVMTGSRGGVLGAAVSSSVLAVLALVHGKRTNARWFGPTIIAFPAIIILSGAFLFYGWLSAQGTRGLAESLSALFDNTSRLNMLGIAASCVALHPFSGGGARSFSWECFRFLDGKNHGDLITHKPEFVHNEVLQTATDYGLIGAGLLGVLFVTLIVGTTFRIAFDEDHPRSGNLPGAWRIGAIASLIGILTQSCFSFVFHLLPCVILLGVFLGFLSTPRNQPHSWKTTFSGIQIALLSLSCSLLLIPIGLQGSQLSLILWPVSFGQSGKFSKEARMDALTEAINISPSAELYQQRATTIRSTSPDDTEAPSKEDLERAIHDYGEAARLHPFDPAPRINRANLLSVLRRNTEAEQDFRTAIHLQGGMEPAFHGHLLLTLHYERIGARQLRDGETADAVTTLRQATREIENSIDQMHWLNHEMRKTRVNMYENLGVAQEAAGDLSGAIDTYDFAAPLPFGSHLHYRAAMVIGKMASKEWSNRRPSEALSLFIQAQKRLQQSHNQIPKGITPAQQKEYYKYLNDSIKFLKGARITPAELTD